MKNRREFLKIFGMVTAAGAALTTVGVVSAKSAPLAAVQTCVKNPSQRIQGTVKRFIDVNPKWIGGPKDHFDHWRNVWANMSGIETAEMKEAIERDNKIYARKQHWPIGPDALMQQQMVDHVFTKSPLLEYLTAKSAAGGTKMKDQMDRDIYTISEVDSDTNLISSTSGTSFTYTTTDAPDLDIDAGPYDRTWDTFKGNE